MSRIDVLASEPHFADHLVPVWRALPEDARGDLIVRRGRYSSASTSDIMARAIRRGGDPTTDETDPTRPLLVASWGDHKAARSMGRTRLARMEHGIGQSFAGSDHPSYAGGRDAADVGLFLVPNHHSGDRWQAAYPAARVEVIGSPKLDTLPGRTSGPRPVVALSFHWGIGDPTAGIIPETHGAFGEYRPYIARLADRYRLIGHGHPRALPHLARTYRRLRIPVVDDFEDVCRKADVYVCDTNSTIFEFASTGRPVVVVNAAHYRRDVEHGLRFWEAATVGVQCDSPALLARSVDAALEDTPAQQAARETALSTVYAHRSGAAARAAEALVSWAASLSPAAVAA